MVDLTLPEGIPAIPEHAERWEKVYHDGVHVVFDTNEPPCRWRFGPRGFKAYIEYVMMPDPVDGVMRLVPKGSGNILSDAVLRKPTPDGKTDG